MNKLPMKIYNPQILYKWAIPDLFFHYFRLFKIADSEEIVDYRIRTTYLGIQKRPQYRYYQTPASSLFKILKSKKKTQNGSIGFFINLGNF